MSEELHLDLKEDNRLPFDIRQQQALVGHSLTEDRFFVQIKDRIKPEWFAEPYASKIFAAQVEFWNKFHRAPLSQDELTSFPSLAKLSMADREKIRRAMVSCKAETQHFGLDFLKAQLTTWAKARLLHRDITQIANLVNSEQVDKAEALYVNSSRELQITRFDGVEPSDMNPKRIVTQQQLDYDNALTFGHPLMDQKLNPESLGNGSLLRGDTTVLIGASNVGKTTVFSTIARHNLVKGKSVLHIVLEGREVDQQEKLWLCLPRKTRAEFRNLVLNGTKEEEQSLLFLEKKYATDYTFLHMVKAGLTVEEVLSVIHINQQRRKATVGKGYDLLIVDYPQILTSEIARGGKWELRQIQDYIYRQFVQLALEEKWHCLLAAQQNKEGAKANENEERLTLPTDVAECWAIAMSATNIMTLNRGPRAIANNRITFYLGKSRSSSTGWAVTCRGDFSRSLSHAPDMDAIAYRGNSSMSDKIEGLLKNYRNSDLPEGMLYGGKA